MNASSSQATERELTPLRDLAQGLQADIKAQVARVRSLEAELGRSRKDTAARAGEVDSLRQVCRQY